MEKGDIIRKKLKGGALIGPYLQVVQINGVFVYAHNITDTENNLIMLLKKNCAPIKRRRLVISDYVFNRLKMHIQEAIIHDATAAWRKLLLEGTELITFKNCKYTYQTITFKVERISTVHYHGEKERIRIELGEEIK